MPPIDPKLKEALMDKLGIGQSALYARISKVADEHFLETDEAALMLAREAGLNVKKFSRPEQRSALRAAAQRPQPNQAAKLAPSAVRTSTRPSKKRTAAGDRKSIFVVHGRDANLRQEFFSFLRALNLHPMEWGTALKEARKGANPDVESVIDACMAKVQAVVVLFSPDEEVRLVPRLRSRRDRNRPDYQPRPNVIFEAGLALGRHPEKTLLIEVGKVRGFSDIAGRHMARLRQDAESRQDIISRLKMLKCDVEQTGTDWLKEGKFPRD